MRRQLVNIISAIISAIRLTLMKVLNSNIKFHFIERISPDVVIEVSRKAKFNLGKMVRIHSGSKIKVRNGAELNIGDNVRINYNCMFISHEKIVIGNGVEFGPNVLIYDHDHDFRCEGGIKTGSFKTSPVFIGDDSWIGAGTIILRGSIIGKNCIVAAGSVVHGTIPDNTILVQKRVNTLKEINI
jgi:acetyltransferase-like isoleucine patch superfamily enzyme